MWHKAKSIGRLMKIEHTHNGVLIELANHYTTISTQGQVKAPYDKKKKKIHAMAKMLVCNLEVSEFELQSRYYVDFRTNTFEERYEPLYPLEMS